jgi:hypothetical protein
MMRRLASRDGVRIEYDGDGHRFLKEFIAIWRLSSMDWSPECLPSSEVA